MHSFCAFTGEWFFHHSKWQYFTMYDSIVIINTNYCHFVLNLNSQISNHSKNVKILHCNIPKAWFSASRYTRVRLRYIRGQNVRTTYQYTRLIYCMVRITSLSPINPVGYVPAVSDQLRASYRHIVISRHVPWIIMHLHNLHTWLSAALRSPADF